MFRFRITKGKGFFPEGTPWMSSQPSEPHNPFYLLLLVASLLFIATALAYGVVPVLEEKAAERGNAPPPSAFRDTAGQFGGFFTSCSHDRAGTATLASSCGQKDACGHNSPVNRGQLSPDLSNGQCGHAKPNGGSGCGTARVIDHHNYHYVRRGR
jgi:hypothetical protein